MLSHSGQLKEAKMFKTKTICECVVFIGLFWVLVEIFAGRWGWPPFRESMRYAAEQKSLAAASQAAAQREWEASYLPVSVAQAQNDADDISAAEQGDPDAQYSLGLRYANGPMLAQNDAEATQQKAVQGGRITEVEHNIMSLEQRGVDVAQYLYSLGEMCDIEKLKANFGKKGVAVSHCWSDTKAEEFYKMAAERGHAKAKYSLGMMYRQYKSGQNEQQRRAEAMKWFRAAAEQGFAEAQYELSLMLSDVEHREEALKWLRMAAEQGSMKGQSALGYRYEKGDWGLAQNEAEAMKWYRQAAAQGDRWAKDMLDCMVYRKNGGEAKNERPPNEQCIDWCGTGRIQPEMMPKR